MILVIHIVNIARSTRKIVVLSTGEAHLIKFLSRSQTIRLADIQEISRRGYSYSLLLSTNVIVDIMAVNDFSRFIADTQEANPSMRAKGC